MARAKSGAKLEAPPPPRIGASNSGTGFSLDLSSLPKSAMPVEGDHKLGANDGTTLTTPRATQEVALTVRGEPKHKQKKLFQVGPDKLGAGTLKFAWRPGGKMIATASTKGGARTPRSARMGVGARARGLA